MARIDKAVVFVDMLGFSALTEAHGVDVADYIRLDRPSSLTFLQAELESSNTNPLAERFVKFHVRLEEAIADQAKMQNQLTAITFSDSAFVAMDSLSDAIDFAVDLVRSMLREHIPIRIGISYGSFVVLRFKADMSLTVGDHSAQFLGTGVVRSHAAEHCGIKGIRILLHPATLPLLDHVDHRALYQRRHAPHPLECSLTERENATGVTHEINYLWTEDRDIEMHHAITRMRAQSPPDVSIHYDATLAAINRMRTALGRQAL